MAEAAYCGFFFIFLPSGFITAYVSVITVGCYKKGYLLSPDQGVT